MVVSAVGDGAAETRCSDVVVAVILEMVLYVGAWTFWWYFVISTSNTSRSQLFHAD